MEDNKNVVPNSVPTSTGYSALTNANNSLASQLKNDAKNTMLKKLKEEQRFKRLL